MEKTLRELELEVGKAIQSGEPRRIEQALNEFVQNPSCYESIRNRLFLMAKRSEPDDLVKEPLLNLDLIVLADITGLGQEEVTENPSNPLDGSNHIAFRFSHEIRKAFGVTKEQLFMDARKNLEDSFRVTSISSVIVAPFGNVREMDQSFVIDAWPGVCTTVDFKHGACALAFPEVFRQCCEANHLDSLYILPSSIHELVLMPTFICDSKELAQMVQDINSSYVQAEDCLDPVVYRYDVVTNEVTIAAAFAETSGQARPSSNEEPANATLTTDMASVFDDPFGFESAAGIALPFI